jgi:hypothetical protein
VVRRNDEFTKPVSEIRTQTVDFANDIGAGESIASQAVEVLNDRGVDQAPGALDGSPSVTETTKVQWTVNDTLAVGTYHVRVTATLNTGEKPAHSIFMRVR